MSGFRVPESLEGFFALWIILLPFIVLLFGLILANFCCFYDVTVAIIHHVGRRRRKRKEATLLELPLRESPYAILYI